MNPPTAPHPFNNQWQRIEAIDGWLARESAALMDFMLEAQDLLKAPGQGLLEIGVWKGRSAALMARHLRPGEDILLADAWLKKDEIIANLSAAMAQRFQQHAVNLFQGTARELATAVGPARRFRFVHVDGEHTGAGLRADLSLARQIVEPTGLIAIDDIFQPMYPHLAKELFTFLGTEGRDLACVMLGFNKAYLCRSRYLDAYGDVVFERINAGMADRNVPVTLCRTTDRMEWPGYSVIADIGKARRGPDFQDDYVRQ
jgi:predicted O-methyltransferase YrrM